MSDTVAVIPGEIPVFTGNLEELDTRVKALSGGGVTISTAASDVHSSFGGLKAFYEAPEAEQLFATTQPVANTGLSLSSDLCVIAGALGTYSNEVRPLKQKLEDLKREAVAFRAHAAQDDKWREDGDLVEENNTRRDEIRETWTAFQEAERACHNKIVALVGGDALKVNDGSNKDNMYGYDAEALKHAKGLPWGDPVKESTPGWQVWEHAYDFGKGFFVDGVWGTIQGLGTLVGFDGWDAMKQAWTGLAQLGTGLVMTAVAGPAFWMASDEELPSWLRDSRTAMKETGKALVAWDQWGENPARAAGTVTFNAITVVFTRGAGSAVAGAGKAGTATKALSFVSKAGRAVDPMTYIFKGAGASLSKISDVLAGLKGTGTIELPPLPDNVFTLPEGAARLPDGTVRLPEGTAIPDGAVRLPDGTIKLPEGTIALPEGTIKLPEDLSNLTEGTVRHPSDAPAYADMDGNLYKADGSILQRAEDARTEPGTTTTGMSNPRVETPARVPEMAGVGARGVDNADGVIRLGDISRTGDDGAAGSTGNRLPGGSAGSSVPNSSASEPLASHETRSGRPTDQRDGPFGGRGDGPSERLSGRSATGHPDESAMTHGDTPNVGQGVRASDGPVNGPTGSHGDSNNAPDRHINSLDHPPLGPTSAVRPDGMRYVDEPSEYSGQVYDEIRATPDSVDIPAMSKNTGVDESVLQRVKTHLFRTEHVVVTEKGIAREGLFTPRDDIGDLWQAAGSRNLDESEALKFQRLVAHEFIESHLMDAGIPYVLDRPQSWEVDMVNGVPDGHYRAWPKNWQDAGAHELSISERKGGFAQWEGLGLQPPSIKLTPNLSNIDEVMTAAFQELRSKGMNLT